MKVMHSTTGKIPEALSKSTMVPIIHKKRNAPNLTNAKALKCFAKVTQHRTKQYVDRALEEDRILKSTGRNQKVFINFLDFKYAFNQKVFINFLDFKYAF